MYEVLYYKSLKGNEPAREFINALPSNVIKKVKAWRDELEKHGPDLPRPYADIVRGKIRELRVRFGSNSYRLMYFFYGKHIIMTHGFMKKTDRVPEREIKAAEHMMRDFLRRYQ